MQGGLIFLMTDSEETVADIAAGLVVVDIPYSRFKWSELAELAQALTRTAPAFVLCDLADKYESVTSGIKELLELRAVEGSGTPLIGLGDLNLLQVEQRDEFVGSIPLPLQFPASAHLLHRLVTECLVGAGRQ